MHKASWVVIFTGRYFHFPDINECSLLRIEGTSFDRQNALLLKPLSTVLTAHLILAKMAAHVLILLEFTSVIVKQDILETIAKQVRS